MTPFLFLIPLLPLLGFVLNLGFGVRLMRRRLGLPGPGLGAWPATGSAGPRTATGGPVPPPGGHDAHAHAAPHDSGHDAGHGAAHGAGPPFAAPAAAPEAGA